MYTAEFPAAPSAPGYASWQGHPNPWLWWGSLTATMVGCAAAWGAMSAWASLVYGATVGASTGTLIWVLARGRTATGELDRTWLFSPAVLYTVGHYAFFVVATVMTLLAGTFEKPLVDQFYCISSVCQLIGLWAFLWGCQAAFGRRAQTQTCRELIVQPPTRRESGAEPILWLVAALAGAMTAYMWGTLIVSGAYFSKAPATSFPGWGVPLEFRWVFYEVGALAPVLVVVCLAQVTWLREKRGADATTSRYVWLVVASIITLLVIGSARVRLGLFMLGLVLACGALVGFKLRRGYIALGIVAAVLAFGLMIVLRGQADRIATTKDTERFWYVWEDAVPRSLGTLLTPSEVVLREREKVGRRVRNAPDFLTRVIAAHWSGKKSLMDGDASRYLLEAYVPRLFWPGKPAINAAGYDPESRIQLHFFGHAEDSAVSALVHLYAEAGLAGIVVGMFLLGGGATLFYRYTVGGRRSYTWGLLVYVPFVAAVPMSEGFTAFHMLGILRLCVLLWLVYKLLEVFVGPETTGPATIFPTSVRQDPYAPMVGEGEAPASRW